MQTALIVFLLSAQSSTPPIRPAPFPAPRQSQPPAPFPAPRPAPPPASLAPAEDAPQQVERPRLISMPDPSRYYPATARAAALEGVTQLRCILTPAGVLTECAIHRSAGSADLDAAAFRIAAEARYTPMRVAGQAVKASVILPVRWVLAE